jgi:hypothetical protein
MSEVWRSVVAGLADEGRLALFAKVILATEPRIATASLSAS